MEPVIVNSNVSSNIAASATAVSSAPTASVASAAKPSTASAADLLAKRNAAAEAYAAENAAAEAQATAIANGATALSSASLSDVRERVVRVNSSTSASGSVISPGRATQGSASGGAANVGGGVGGVGGVGGSAADLQNLLFSGDATPLDGISVSASAGVSFLDHKLLESALGSGDGSARNAAVDKAVERIREELDQGAQADGQAVAGSLVLSTSFSVGYVLWLARGGVLLASMASSIPAWATVDPLPVLSRFKSRHGEEAGGLEGPDGSDGAASGGKADALERLFSKAKKVFSGAESATAPMPQAAPQPVAQPIAQPIAQPTPQPPPVAPSTAQPTSPTTATEPSEVTP